jgi:hypothetical protein
MPFAPQKLEFFGRHLDELLQQANDDSLGIACCEFPFEPLNESRWVDEAFNALFDNMPENMHMILITRQIPNFNFLPLIEKQKMLKIGMEDLVFRFDEITELLKDVYSIDYSEDGIKLLDNMGGWITDTPHPAVVRQRLQHAEVDLQ